MKHKLPNTIESILSLNQTIQFYQLSDLELTYIKISHSRVFGGGILVGFLKDSLITYSEGYY